MYIIIIIVFIVVVVVVVIVVVIIRFNDGKVFTHQFGRKILKNENNKTKI